MGDKASTRDVKEELLPEVADVLDSIASPSSSTPLTMLPEDLAEIMGGQGFHSRHSGSSLDLAAMPSGELAGMSSGELAGVHMADLALAPVQEAGHSRSCGAPPLFSASPTLLPSLQSLTPLGWTHPSQLPAARHQQEEPPPLQPREHGNLGATVKLEPLGSVNTPSRFSWAFQAPPPRTAETLSEICQRAGHPALGLDLAAEPSWLQPLRSAATMPETPWQEPLPPADVAMADLPPFAPQQRVLRTARTTPGELKLPGAPEPRRADEQRRNQPDFSSPQESERSSTIRSGMSRGVARAEAGPSASSPTPRAVSLPTHLPAADAWKGRRVTGARDSLPGWFMLDPPSKRARPASPFAAGPEALEPLQSAPTTRRPIVLPFRNVHSGIRVINRDDPAADTKPSTSKSANPSRATSLSNSGASADFPISRAGTSRADTGTNQPGGSGGKSSASGEGPEHVPMHDADDSPPPSSTRDAHVAQNINHLLASILTGEGVLAHHMASLSNLVSQVIQQEQSSVSTQRNAVLIELQRLIAKNNQLEAQEVKLSSLHNEVQHMQLEQLTSQGREQMLLQVITDVEGARFPSKPPPPQLASQDPQEEAFPVNEEWASADRQPGNIPLAEVYAVVHGPVDAAKQQTQVFTGGAAAGKQLSIFQLMHTTPASYQDLCMHCYAAVAELLQEVQGGGEGSDAAAKRIAQIVTEQAAASIAFAAVRPTMHRHMRAYCRGYDVKPDPDFWAGVVEAANLTQQQLAGFWEIWDAYTTQQASLDAREAKLRLQVRRCVQQAQSKPPGRLLELATELKAALDSQMAAYAKAVQRVTFQLLTPLQVGTMGARASPLCVSFEAMVAATAIPRPFGLRPIPGRRPRRS